MNDFLDNMANNFNDVKTESEFDPADANSNLWAAVIPYLIPFLFFIPLIANNNSKFCRFHANQQLVWCIACFVVNIVAGILKAIIPILGILLTIVIDVAILAISLFLMYSAYNKKAVRLPVIGDIEIIK